MPLPILAADILAPILLVVALIIGLVVFLVLLKFFKTWLRAKLSQATVSMGSLIGMWLRKVPFVADTNRRIPNVLRRRQQ